jgi:hypothetical protein
MTSSLDGATRAVCTVTPDFEMFLQSCHERQPREKGISVGVSCFQVVVVYRVAGVAEGMIEEKKGQLRAQGV